MNEKFAEHAQAGPWHYETRFVGGVWEWEILETLKGKIASGTAISLQAAKDEYIVHTGRAPEKWQPIGPSLS